MFGCHGDLAGCSIHEHTGEAVVIAFTAGNLLEVSKFTRSKFPDTKIIIAADNDAETERKTGINPGIEKARVAAQTINAGYIYPKFNPEIEGTDFNDYLNQGGVL